MHKATYMYDNAQKDSPGSTTICTPDRNRTRRANMSIGMILLIVLVLALVGVLPTWGHSANWGYGPSGGVGLVVLILLILLLMGKI
jgi:uncharacterized membrane protein YkgB